MSPNEQDGVAGVQEPNYGLMTLRTAEARGISYAEIRRNVRSGSWSRMHRGVYATSLRSELGLRGELAAARLAARGGVVAGHSAARLWNLTGAVVTKPELVLSPDDTREQQRGIRLSWRALDVGDITDVEGFPTTTVARTLLDLARRDPLRIALPLVDSALHQLLLPPSALPQLAAIARRGRAAFVFADGRSESVFESLVRLDLVQNGLAPEALQFDVYDQAGRWLARADMAWPSRGLLLELDGFATHGTPEAFRADLQRQNGLIAAGWTVLRFTWRDRPRISSAIRSALAA